MPEKKLPPVKIKFDSRHQEALKNAHAYVFENATGKLLESKPVVKGELTLETSPDLMRSQVQLIIGPAMPKELGRNLTPGILQSAGGFQTSIRLSNENLISVSAIPAINWPAFWPLCHVRGNLTKSFIIDGVERVLPVCEARVHICDIDRISLWWPNIPDRIFADLAAKLRPHFDWPVPPRIPFPLPNPIGPLPQPGNPGIRIAKVMSNTTGNVKTIGLPVLPLKLQTAIVSNSTSAIKSAVLEHYHDLHAYFCLWPWCWPWFYRCTEVGTAKTDCNGHFDFSYWDFGKKNIYVWVEVLIGGSWVTVYKPSRPCHTFWNYACGTDINIRITDERVRQCSCDSLPGDLIWMKSINFGKSIRSIQQSSAGSGHLANAVGLTQFGAFGNISPFGSTFPLVVQFGAGFPKATASHYRWKFRRILDGALQTVVEGENNLAGEIGKPYTYPIIVAGNPQLASNSFTMGPTVVGGNAQYKIPHTTATLDVPEAGALWDRQDTATIYLRTVDLDMEGLYELTFELVNAAGAVQAVPANTYIVSKKASDVTIPGQETVTANGLPENYVVKNGAGQAVAFRFYLRVDNNRCYADVQDAIVPSGTTDTECGFGYYNNKATDTVTLRFVAGHPHDFATYSFAVTKGNSNPVAAANSSGVVTVGNNGYAVGDSPQGASPRDAYSKVIPVATMLGACPQAAFAENLYVNATHTDGVNELNNLDASDTAAIAIAPAPLP
jgi:hypothetical protein